MQTILDCYTDEPAGLGVPPYLGTYPRYIAGQLENPYYLTIDDLRAHIKYSTYPPEPKPHEKTDITTYNLTRNFPKIREILHKTTELIIIVGVHTPGKYLSAMPGTINELRRLLKDIKCKKILTGPAVHGTQLHGGKRAEKMDDTLFHEVRAFDESYDTIKDAAIKGAQILEQITYPRIMEIETSRGCSRNPGCSFCLEPIKNTLTFRREADILAEVKALHDRGARHFRLGKQSCVYLYPTIVSLLQKIHELGVQTLHIDNANPINVVNDTDHQITKAIVSYCTEGNVAAFGAESFDPAVVEKNNLNSDPHTTMEAIRILNRYGADRGPKGLPRYLPGINILFGLDAETKETFQHNHQALKAILDEGLLLRRINIRQVVPFEGTPLHQQAGNKYLRKNRRHYYSWRKKIREDIDYPMLQHLAPKDSLFHEIIPEIYDGKTTFCRHMGTYPLIVGVKERLPLRQPRTVQITGYMLRSLIGRVVP
ncbi:MAG: radical SAM protein [Nanobdellota archaeon]